MGKVLMGPLRVQGQRSCESQMARLDGCGSAGAFMCGKHETNATNRERTEGQFTTRYTLWTNV